MTKTLVQFDGSNFYNRFKQLLPQTHLTNYNYAELANFLAKKKNHNVVYYVGEIKKYKNNKKSKKLYSSQQSLFTNLRKQNIDIKLGYLLKSNNKYHEKGVDVQMAVDITKGAIKGEFQKCFLVSSDTDLLPAIKVAQKEGKKIIYVAFDGSISRAMKENCDSTIILTKKDLKNIGEYIS